MTKEDQTISPLGEFLIGTTEDWKGKLQDRNFTYQFPSRVKMFLLDDRHDQFLREHGNTIITSAVSAFMQLPWTPRDKGSIGVTNMAFTKEGKTIPFLQHDMSKPDKAEVTDSLMRAEIASLFLLGFNPANQENTKQMFTLGFAELTTDRKKTFRNNTFGVIAKNSSVRAWIKINDLDAKNGFVWDRDVTKFAPSLLPAINNAETGPAIHLPPELLELDNFSAQTVEVFVDHMLDLLTRLSEITNRKKRVTLLNYTQKFLIEVDQYNGHTIPQEKLERLYTLISVR